MSEKKKYPDNVVFNEETDKFDANTKQYPTTIGSQKFEVTQIDKSESIKASKYFDKRLAELKKEWEELVDDYQATNLVYGTDYNFQPSLGEVYHIYKDRNNKDFLSIINPNEWDREYVGSYMLNSNGVWEKLEYGNT